MADVTITITIPDAKVVEFQVGYFKAMPIRKDMTEKQSVKADIIEWLRGKYCRGKSLLSKDAAIIETDVFI